MSRFSIISKSDSSVVRFTGTPVYNGTYLKPSYLEFREVSSPTPINWEVGDYVDYSRTGFRYKLYSSPQVKKQARRDSYGGAFVYQNVQLFDRTKDFDICPFRDLVPEDNGIHFSTQPAISTFENVEGIARRIQACLDDMYDDWEVRVVSSDAPEDAEFIEAISEPRDFTVSGVSILGALDKIYEVWPLCGWTYTVEGSTNVLTLGGASISSAKTAAQTFLYGKGHGLKDIKKTYSNAGEIATRVYAYGSSRNMIPRYYNNKSIKDAESVDIANLMIPISSWGITDNLPDANKAYIEDATAIANLGLRPTTIYFDGTGDYPEVYPTLEGITIGDLWRVMSSTDTYYPKNVWSGEERVDEIMSAMSPVDSGETAQNGKAFIEGTSINSTAYSEPGPIRSAEYELFSYDVVGEGLNTLSISGIFQGEITYLGSPTAQTSCYVRVSILLEDSEGGQSTYIKDYLPFLYPTNTYKRYGLVMPDANWFPEFKSSDKEIKNVTLTFICTVSDDIALNVPSITYSLGLNTQRSKTFTVNLRQIGFNLDLQAALGDGKSIAMKTGMCAGRTFEIQASQYNSATDTWELTLYRSEDTSIGTWFPNATFPIVAGDRFVLLDIAMPETYITVASEKLLARAQEFLAYSSTLQPFYEPDIDPKFMIENSIIIHEGEYMALEDEDIISGRDTILIDSLTINEGEAAIPTYKVTLRERKKKTWTQSVSNAIERNSQSVNTTSSSNSGSSAIVNYPQFFEEDGNGNIKLKDQYNGLWARGFVSAGGISEEGGGGGGGGSSDVTVLRSWGAYNESDQNEALGSNLGMGLRNSLNSLNTTVGSIDSRVTALEQAGGTNVTWGSEPADPGTVVDLNVSGTAKTLLKANALEYSDKAVGLITETDFNNTLNTFFPIPS